MGEVRGISGVVYDFEVYTGKATQIEGILMGGNDAYGLTLTLPLNENYKVFFDNFFSSIALLKLLKKEGLLAVATLRKDRLKDAGKFVKSENELKKSNRGSCDYVVDYNSAITILRWFDNNSVQLISNYVGNGLGEPARR